MLIFAETKTNIMYELGDHVKVSDQNDNENYDSFKDKTLVVTSIAICEEHHPGYDKSMLWMQLMDFKTVEGEEINCSLYEYEVDPA